MTELPEIKPLVLEYLIQRYSSDGCILRKACQVELTEGAHQVWMNKTDHFERNGGVTITSDQREVEWRLDLSFDLSFATLSLSAQYSQTDLYLKYIFSSASTSVCSLIFYDPNLRSTR